MTAFSAPQLRFDVTDRWGQLIQVTARRWQKHVIHFHPELANQENLVKDAIQNPEAVLEGDTPDDKKFVGKIISGGNASKLVGRVVVAVVNYANGSKFQTAYATRPPLKGKVIWP
jgi:hypothetical protein